MWNEEIIEAVWAKAETRKDWTELLYQAHGLFLMSSL